MKRVVRGGRDRSLARVVRQMRGLVPSPILRPMPEPNTRWYAWPGTVSGNSPDDYVAAWRRVHRVAKRASGGWVKVMWAPYHRNIPARAANAPAAYFPGDEYVDLVGASGYNFGRQRGLRWISPSGLFTSSYRTITGLSDRPFWIAETATTARGGSKAGWMRALAALPARLPRLNGIVWYDVRDGKGDFRVRQSRATLRAFRAFLRRAGAR